MKKSSKIEKIVFIALLFIGAFLRFYKLDWGEGFFFHPDEYHIITSALRYNFDDLHPHFFSYGSFISYLIFFSSKILALFKTDIKTFSNFMLIGRFHSALFSTLSLLVFYKITAHFLKNYKFRLTALAIAVFTPGLIQQAHFTTPESYVIFFLLLVFLAILKFLNTKSKRYFFLSAVFLGIAVAVKISSISFGLAVITAYIFNTKIKIKNLGKIFFELVIAGAIVSFVFFLFFPYAVIDYTDFISSFRYESAVATGMDVFYTKQFRNTVPVIFQLVKIYPYTLNIFVLLMAIIGFFIALKDIILTKKRTFLSVLAIAFLALFLPNAFLYAKWTRFIAPTFYFMILFAVLGGKSIFTKSRQENFFLILMSVSAVFWGLMFFSIYLRSDVRLIASRWIEKNIPGSAVLLMESGNMLDLPLGIKTIYNRSSFDFYRVENQPNEQEGLINLITESDYFIIQSRRVFANYSRLPDIYPFTAGFYRKFFSGEMGFEKIAEFDSYPGFRINGLELEIPDETAEETWTVFDHPVIRIYEKKQPHSYNYYKNLLKNE